MKNTLPIRLRQCERAGLRKTYSLFYPTDRYFVHALKEARSFEQASESVPNLQVLGAHLREEVLTHAVVLR